MVVGPPYTLGPMASIKPHTPVWIGPSWERSGWEGLKLLILAEKFPARSVGLVVGTGLDAELVGRYVDGSLKHRQFTDVARLVFGEAKPRTDCASFWNSVALSNLFPGGARLTSRSEPTAEDWDSARAEVHRLLRDLKPTALLVLGARLADQIKSCWEDPLIEQAFCERIAWAPHPGIAG